MVEQFGDDDYMVQVDLDLNSAKYGEIWVLAGYHILILAQTTAWSA